MKNNIELLNERDFEVLDELLGMKRRIKPFVENAYPFCNRPEFINSLYYIDEYEPEVQEKLRTFCKYFKEYKTYWSSKSDKGLCQLSDIINLVGRLKKINLAYEAIKSDKSDYTKAYELLCLYKSPEEFKKLYCTMIKKIENPNLAISKEALENFDLICSKFEEYNENGILEKVRYFATFRSYFENYEYAKFAIEEYINDEESYKIEKYLSKLGIDKDTFMFCVNAIRELDPDLYGELLKKKAENQKLLHLKNVKTIEGLVRGIETGYINDNTEFNIFEFIKRVPFKGSPDFYEKLNRYISEVCPQYYKTISKYLQENQLYAKSSLEPVDVRKIYGTRMVIEGTEVTEEMKNDVLDFLKYNKIPLVNRTYNVALRKYLNGEITKEMIEAKKEEVESQMQHYEKPAIKVPIIKKR